MKHRIVHTLQKYFLNPPIKLAVAIGLPLPGYALLETKGRKTGKPRRTPVGYGRIANQFWLVAEHGTQAGYVRNIERDPQVRLKLREGLKYRWHAHLLSGDDPRERQRWLASQMPSRAGNARACACSGHNSSVFELIWIPDLLKLVFMTTDDIRLLYEYDRWANRRVLAAASRLSDEQFTRPTSGSFQCMRDTLLHILGGEWIWLAYWRNPPDNPASLSDLRAKRDALFSPEAFPNVDALQSKWKEVQLEQSEFVDQMNDESLAKMLLFGGTRLSLMHLMQHVVNHSTYHRGQVALTMRQLGAEPLATDFYVFLLERLGDSATA